MLIFIHNQPCLLYTSDAADERSSVDLGGRRIIKKKKQRETEGTSQIHNKTEIATKVLEEDREEHKKERKQATR